MKLEFVFMLDYGTVALFWKISFSYFPMFILVNALSYLVLVKSSKVVLTSNGDNVLYLLVLIEVNIDLCLLLVVLFCVGTSHVAPPGWLQTQ